MDPTDKAVAEAAAASAQYVWPKRLFAVLLCLSLLLVVAVGWSTWRIGRVDAARREATARTEAEIVAEQRRSAHDVCRSIDAQNQNLRAALHSFFLLVAGGDPASAAKVPQFESILDRGLPIIGCPPP